MDINLTQENFKRQIELFVGAYQNKALCANTREEQMKYIEAINLVKATISRTLRLCLQYPELAQEYLDNLPKATMD
jgi:hypothetical protein